MKHFQVLVVVGLAAGAVSIIAGVGSASASVLCKATANPCPAESKLAAETKVEAALPPGVESIFESTDKEFINTWCQESEISGTTENTGSATESVRVAISKWSWGGCTTVRKLVTLKTGQFEIHYREGTGTGTITGKGMEFTAETILGSDCVYGAPVSSPLDFGVTREPGALETQSQIEMSVAMPRLTPVFGCPEDAVITARYTISTPAPLYVAGS